jgi:hypothetical protein
MSTHKKYSEIYERLAAGSTTIDGDVCFDHREKIALIERLMLSKPNLYLKRALTKKEIELELSYFIEQYEKRNKLKVSTVEFIDTIDDETFNRIKAECNFTSFNC